MRQRLADTSASCGCLKQPQAKAQAAELPCRLTRTVTSVSPAAHYRLQRRIVNACLLHLTLPFFFSNQLLGLDSQRRTTISDNASSMLPRRLRMADTTSRRSRLSARCSSRSQSPCRYFYTN